MCVFLEWVRTKWDLGLSSQIRMATETWSCFVKESNLELVSQYYLGMELESRSLKKIVLKKKLLELPVDQSLNYAINCWLQSGLVRTKSKSGLIFVTEIETGTKILIFFEESNSLLCLCVEPEPR